MARRHIITEYLDIDTAKCAACGECIEACSNEVLKLVGIKFLINHRHIKAAFPDKCCGCLSCIEACPEGAIKGIAWDAKWFIKDRILKLDPDEMEELVAALLRGMGYKARVTPKGPDRGVDVFASPDGLGLEEPRIKTEVKHRPYSAMGSQEIRSFLGGLRAGDRGIYVSTVGFTKEAKYEADRATVPVTLLTLVDLASLVVTYYESFDLNGRALIPLVRVYWPAE